MANPFFILLIDAGVLGLIVLGVFFVARRIEAGLNIRRRVRGETTSAAPSAAAPVVRREAVRNPVLAWVQDASLSDPQARTKLRRDLIHAGFTAPSAPAWYVVIRFALAVGLPVAFLFGLKVFGWQMTGPKLIFIPLFLCGVSLLAPRAFVDNRAGARRAQIEREFPDALDLLLVCVEAGLGLEAAFIRVGDETMDSHPRISVELRTVSQELRAGRSRGEALRGFADRTQVDVIQAFVALLIQTDALGVSIAQSLRTYSLEMRQTRMLKAEEKAMRIPVLMTLPLVAFILPVIVGAVMLPGIINIVRNVMPAFN